MLLNGSTHTDWDAESNVNWFQLKSEWEAHRQTSFSFQLEMRYEGMNKLFEIVYFTRSNIIKKGQIKIVLLPFCNFWNVEL